MQSIIFNHRHYSFPWLDIQLWNKILDLYAPTQAAPAHYSPCQCHMSCHKGLKLTFANPPNTGWKLAGAVSIPPATLAGEPFWSWFCMNTKLFPILRLWLPYPLARSLFKQKISQNIHFLIDYWFAPIAFPPGVLWQWMLGLLSLRQQSIKFGSPQHGSSSLVAEAHTVAK